jgi:YVTN family beta-propeller protein
MRAKRIAAIGAAGIVLALPGAVRLAAAPASASAPSPPTAYITNNLGSSVTAINTGSKAVLATIPIDAGPTAVAVSPDGSSAYVVSQQLSSLTVIDTTTNAVSTKIGTGQSCWGMAVTPDGSRAYLACNDGALSVNLTTSPPTVGARIPVPPAASPWQVAITPDGLTAYVTGPGTLGCACQGVYPIEVATNAVRAAITGLGNPQGIVITPDGATAYVTDTATGHNQVFPITLAGAVVGPPIPVGSVPIGLTLSPDGKTLYATNNGSASVTPIDLTTSPPTVRPVIALPAGVRPMGIAITPDGRTAFVNSRSGSTVIPIDLTTSPPTVGAAITVGSAPFGIAITPAAALAVRSVTVSPSSNVFDSCATPAGATTGTALTFPNGACSTTGANRVSVTNGAAPGHVAVAGSAATPVDGGTPWTLCGGAGAPVCGNGVDPGPDQYLERGVNGTAAIVLTSQPQCDTAFSGSGTCAAGAGQSALETLQLEGPSASTDNSGTFTTVWTWTAVP